MSAVPLGVRTVHAVKKLIPLPIRRALLPLVRRVRSVRRTIGPKKSLDAIGIGTGTDKSSRYHDYLNVYEHAFQDLRTSKFQMVEIGVHQGASIRMWEEFFPRASLIGVDISTKCKKYATDRVSIVIGDQSKQDFLDSFGASIDPTIVLDDGSHVWSHQIETFKTLFPILRPGGFYVIEDIHTSFSEPYAKTYGSPGGQTAYDFIADIARGITAHELADPTTDDFDAYARNNIESLVFLKHSVLIQKSLKPRS